MYQLSDSDSVDSDEGVRYKTDSIRNKEKCIEKDSISKGNSYSRRDRRRSRSRSPQYHENKRKKSKKARKEYSSEDNSEKSSKYKYRKKDAKSHRDKGKNIRECDSSDKKPKYSLSPGNEIIKNDIRSTGSDIPLNTHNIKRDIVDQGQVLGPALPPHLSQKSILPGTDLVDKSGGLLPNVKPTHNAPDINSPSTSEVIGPTLPPRFNKTLIENDINDKIPKLEKNTIVGPALPPDLVSPKKLEASTIIGPALPPNFKQPSEPLKIDNCDQHPNTPQETVNRIIGASIPPDLKKRLEEENSNTEVFEEVYGPIPVGENFSRAHIELEERALKMRINQLEPEADKQPVREDWMMTLPEAKATKFGLGPRSFRAKAGPDLSDRSSWTDTPEDKAKKREGKEEPKVDLKREAEQKEIRKRDKEQEAIAKKNKKHKESLVEMHQKKLKKEKNESDPSERRPFSREIDLQVNRFDEAQKKAVLKKAQLLDTRFSTGESKYL